MSSQSEVIENDELAGLITEIKDQHLPAARIRIFERFMDARELQKSLKDALGKGMSLVDAALQLERAAHELAAQAADQTVREHMAEGHTIEGLRALYGAGSKDEASPA